MRRSSSGFSVTAWIIAAVVLMAAVEGAAAPVSRDADASRFAVTDGPLEFRVEVDKPVAQVAEPVLLTLLVEAPRGTLVELPMLSEQLGPFEVLQTATVKELPVDGSTSLRCWMLTATLETIRTGALQIPPLELHYALEGDRATLKTVQSQPLAIRIKSVLEDRADPTNFRDIKDVVDVEVPPAVTYTWLWWTLGGVGAVAGFTAMMVIVQRQRSRQSPADWALAEISQLQESQLAGRAGLETTYNELAEIVREFVEMQFGLPALSQTTADFLDQVVRCGKLSETAQRELQSFLSISDEVKFARLEIRGDQVASAFSKTRDFIAECEKCDRDSGEDAA